MNSISNRQLTLLRKLNRKKYRQQEQLFLIESARAVEQLIENGALDIKFLCFDESQQYWLEQPWSRYVHEIDSVTLEGSEFAAVSDTENPQGVLAVCGIPEEMELDELNDVQGLVLAIDAVQDPGNLGTIIRTASWFGAAAILSGKGTVDLFHPKVVRSTAGATGTVPFKNGNLIDDLATLEEEGWQIVLLDGGDDAGDLREVSSHSKLVLVVGNEANGIDASLPAPQRIKAKVSSPTNHKQVESLNAAIAAAIALFHFSGRQ